MGCKRYLTKNQLFWITIGKYIVSCFSNAPYMIANLFFDQTTYRYCKGELSSCR